MNSNVIVSNGYACTSCMHPFVASFLSFENLPLVEFKVDPSISPNKVLELLNSDKPSKPLKKKKK
jgi:intraflagellar transport protein 122